MGKLASVSTSESENVDKNYVTVQTLHQYSSVQFGRAIHLSKIYRHIPEKEPEMKSGWVFSFFFLHYVLFQILFVMKKTDEYSLWHSQINGWVQKCREQAAEEDVGSTGHRRAVCTCQWKYTLTNLWLQAEILLLDSLIQTFTMLTVFALLTVLLMKKVNHT